MAEEHHHKSHEYEPTTVVSGGDEGSVEKTDRGLFDFLGKKDDEKKDEQAFIAEFEKVQVSEPEPPKSEELRLPLAPPPPPAEEEEKKPSLLEKLRRSDSSSSSSSDEEEGEKGEKKKKKKGLKEKLLGKKDEEEERKGEEPKYEETSVPVEKYEEPVVTETVVQPEEKKGLLDKIKEKLPGHKKAEEVHVTPPPTPTPAAEESGPTSPPGHDGEAKEKKGILEKIKEKLPGYHPKTEEEKEKEKE